jgi:uncharacterized repeat protein (TIGR01451 family)
MKIFFNHLGSMAVVCAALFLLPGGQVCAAGSRFLHGNVPAVVAGLQPIRKLDDTNQLKLAIGLPLHNKEALTNLLQRLYDPASPDYHQYLTPAQFTEKFGPTAQDYQTVINFAKASGLAVAATHDSRILLDVQGKVSDIEKAFHVTLRTYQHPTEPRQFYAPDVEPSVDASLPIQDIAGLSDYAKLRPALHKMKAKGAHTGPALGSAPGGNYMGHDFRNAYAPGVSLDGTGQKVGLFEADGYYASDITAYETLAGLPNVPLINVFIDGANGPDNDSDGVGEVSLDIEMAISMAPGLSAVVVYEVPGDLNEWIDALDSMAASNQIKQLSSSWGYTGSPDPNTSFDAVFQKMAMQGQSFFQASGDGDAWITPIWVPGDSPYLTSVGGTTLTMSGLGTAYISDTVWNWGYDPPGWPGTDNGYWGSGGGVSTVYSIPSWQQGVNMTTNLGSTTMRNVPDVALTGNEIWVIFDNGQSGSFGGTSCAAPLWAGFIALVNQQAAANGSSTAGFINPAIYALGQGTNYTSCFNDVTTGNNTWSNSPTKYFAVPGYDLCAGWGTPTGSNLINALAPVSFTPVLVVVTNVITGGNGNGVIDFDECNNLTIILTNGGGVPATGIRATLSSTTTGAIVAQGTSAYPTLLPGSSAGNLTLFTLSTEPTFVCGTPVNLTLVVTCDQLIVPTTNYIQISSGVVGTPDSFTNSTASPIPATFTPVNSPITVSGLQAVGKLTVSVFLSALYDVGLSLTLTSPNGTNVILSQNNGGLGSDYGAGCGAGAYATFDDAAPISIADPINAVPPYVGSYAPQEPLSVFHLMSGTNLNGTWTLQVLDEFPGDTAMLECWALNISPEVCVDGGGQCPGANLSLTMSASPNPVYVNSNLVYNLTVSNAGPSAANNVLIIQGLPAGVGFVTTSNYPVTASQAGSNLNLLLGSLPVYASATVSVITIPTIPGFVTSTATVGSAEVDPNLTNNTASAGVVVSEQTANMAVSMTGSPGSVLEGGLLTYTINVTNNGPFTANDVFLATTLPANVNLISATVANVVSADLGAIGLGTNVVVTIVVSPTNTGNITASTVVALAPPEIDPITFNNSASVSTTVEPAADLSVTAFATPSPLVAGSNLTYIVTVSNAAGLSGATGVVFSQSLPAGSSNVSSSLAGFTVSNNLINATIGNMAGGGSILITNVVKSPTLLSGVQSNLLTSTFSVFGQPADPNTNNNTATLQTVEEPPTETIVAAGAMVTSGSVNGSVGTNGTYGVQLFLQNVGNIPTTTNLMATLLATNGVTPVSGSNIYNYQVLTNGAAPTAGQYAFTNSGANGGTNFAVLQLEDGSSNLGTVSFAFVMPVVQTFWNTKSISIPEQSRIPEPDSGPANSYPSVIMVSNVIGDVSAVTVTVSNLAHTYPHDIGMLLIGPTNQSNPNGLNCVLMSAAAEYSTMTNPVTITFDQNAAAPLPTEGLEEGQIITNGSYQPSDYNPSDAYSNSPVPVGPYNTDLSFFGNISSNGTASFSANGTWYLYVYDDANGDAGAISNGWGLTITTVTPLSPLVRLMVSTVEEPNPAVAGNYVNYQITVTNLGPNAATNVVLTNMIPSGTTLVASSSYTSGGGMATCNLGTINAGASTNVTIEIQVNVGANGTITNTAIATTAGNDPSMAGSTNVTTTTVTTLPAPSLPPSAVSLSGGLLQFMVTGAPGQSYVIESSSNLVSWIPVLTNTGTFTFTNCVTNNPQLFYRVVQLP